MLSTQPATSRTTRRCAPHDGDYTTPASPTSSSSIGPSALPLPRSPPWLGSCGRTPHLSGTCTKSATTTPSPPSSARVPSHERKHHGNCTCAHQDRLRGVGRAVL